MAAYQQGAVPSTALLEQYRPQYMQHVIQANANGEDPMRFPDFVMQQYKSDQASSANGDNPMQGSQQGGGNLASMAKFLARSQ